MLCAYRYERGGSFLRNSLDSHLKVQCVYLGSTFTGDINTISNESWWNTQIAIPDKVTTRIFPITGHVVPPIQSPHSMISDNGVSAYIWCQTDMKLGPSIIRIDDYSADLHYSTVFIIVPIQYVSLQANSQKITYYCFDCLFKFIK